MYNNNALLRKQYGIKINCNKSIKVLASKVIAEVKVLNIQKGIFSNNLNAKIYCFIIHNAFIYYHQLETDDGSLISLYIYGEKFYSKLK